MEHLGEVKTNNNKTTLNGLGWGLGGRGDVGTLNGWGFFLGGGNIVCFQQFLRWSVTGQNGTEQDRVGHMTGKQENCSDITNTLVGISGETVPIAPSGEWWF